MATATKTAEKIFGKFQAESEIGRMAALLADGEEHSKDEILKAIKPKTGRIINKTKKLIDYGKESKLYTLNVSDDGVYQMTVSATGTGRKPAPKKSASKK